VQTARALQLLSTDFLAVASFLHQLPRAQARNLRCGMVIRTSFIYLIVLVAPRVLANDDSQRKDDEQLLAEAKIELSAGGLREYFRAATPGDVELKKVATLLTKLGSDDFGTREQASEALVAMGPRILPILRTKLNHQDPETKNRLQACVEKLKASSKEEDIAAAAARLLRRHNPQTAADVLLAFLRWVNSDDVENEVLITLVEASERDGKVLDTLAGMLDDASPKIRGVAALLLARGDKDEHKNLARKALKDQDAEVRFRAAQGLLSAGDKTATAEIIELLADAPLPVAQKAEQLLVRLAGESSPCMPLGTDDKLSGKCRSGWQGWYADRVQAAELPTADVVRFPSAAMMARDTVRRYIDAGRKRDTEALAKTLAGRINVLSTGEVSRDELLRQLKGARDWEKLRNIKSMNPDEILALAPDGKTFSDSFANRRVEAVIVPQEGNTENLVLVLQPVGDRWVICGLARTNLQR
jgi:hypothetical protein